MKGRRNRFLTLFMIICAALFIGGGSMKTYAARQLPVGGLAKRDLPTYAGITDVSDKNVDVLQVTPKKARLETGLHYDYLNDEEKFLYAAVYQAIMDKKYVPYADANNEAKYDDYKYVISVGKESYVEKFQNITAFAYALIKAQTAASYDHPDKVDFYMVGLEYYGAEANNGIFSTYIILVAQADDTKFDEYDAAINASANAIVNEIKGNRNATSAWDAVNEKIAYDYYCGDYNLEYDHAGMQRGFYDYCHTAYGSLVLHKAVCDGYSKGFALIMKKMGIPTMVNDGVAFVPNGDGGHAWNMVQLDGNWYEIDTTWDDLDGNAYDHTFFNKTTSQFARGEGVDNEHSKHVRTVEANYVSIRFPAATGTHWTIDYLNAGNYAKDTEVKLNSISFQNSVYMVKPGDKIVFDLYFEPEEASNKKFYLLSSDASVVYANGMDYCIAQSNGTATIRAISVEDQSIVAECTVIVSEALVHVTGVSVDEKIQMVYGQEMELNPVITPENATYRGFVLESSNEEIISVNGNKIKGLKQGNATVKVTTQDGKYTAECNVDVVIPDGEVFEASGYKYMVTGADTAALIGSTNAKLNIPEKFEAAGGTFKVTAIADKAFYKNKKITQVKGGKNLKYIGRDSFFNCKNLKSVDFSTAGITEIGYQAFYKCKKLSAVKINGNSLKTCEKDIFAGIKKKAKITVYAKTKKKYNSVVKAIEGTGVTKVTFKRKK